jgi:hypothetical protein
VDYDKEEAKRLIGRELGWRDYGGKHYESVWTRFFQGYYLPTKFGYDKRKAHLSTLIVSGQLTRNDALAELEQPSYDSGLLQQDLQFVTKKFGLTREEFDAIIKSPPRDVTEFPSNYLLLHQMERYKNVFRRIATTP